MTFLLDVELGWSSGSAQGLPEISALGKFGGIGGEPRTGFNRIVEIILIHLVFADGHFEIDVHVAALVPLVVDSFTDILKTFDHLVGG